MSVDDDQVFRFTDLYANRCAKGFSIIVIPTWSSRGLRDLRILPIFSRQQLMLLPITYRPSELRDQIYSFALLEPYSVVSERTHRHLYHRQRHPVVTECSNPIQEITRMPLVSMKSADTSPRLILPALCKTSRLLREESLGVFFGLNRFRLMEALLRRWLFGLSDDTVQHIRRIRLERIFEKVPPDPLVDDNSATRPNFVVCCDVTLSPQEPYFRCKGFYLFGSPGPALLDLLQTRLDQHLRSIFTGSDRPCFTKARLTQIWDSWMYRNVRRDYSSAVYPSQEVLPARLRPVGENRKWRDDAAGREWRVEKQNIYLEKYTSHADNCVVGLVAGRGCTLCKAIYKEEARQSD